ncbi:MAG: DUF1292 domain-containing protein [Clostridium sp.]|nr:DUF1292 domain-containing protein [Clostridium sp.]
MFSMEIMSFKDEDGNKIDFEAVAKVYLEKQEYLILAPLDESIEEEYAFRVDIVDGKEEYNLVEDDEEFQQVKKEYKKLLY